MDEGADVGLFDIFRGGPKKSTAELLAEARALVAAGKTANAIRVYCQISPSDRTPAILAETASAYLTAGHMHNAEAHATQALAENSTCAEAVCVLGEILVRKGREAEAKVHFQAAIDLGCERARDLLAKLTTVHTTKGDGPGVPERRSSASGVDAITARARLADIRRAITEFYERWKYREAVSLAREAVHFAVQHFGNDDPDTVAVLNNLGVLLYWIGNYAEARDCMEQVLEVQERVLRSDHPNIISTLSNLGELLRIAGDYKSARRHLERALEIQKKEYGDDHPNTAAGLKNLGVLLGRMGDYTRAREYLEQALDVWLRVYGADHHDTAGGRDSLGSLLHSMGDYTTALRHLERALVIRERLLGSDHPDTTHTRNSLSNLLQTTGEYEGARKLLEQALQIRKSRFGDDDPDTATIRNNLGCLFLITGDAARSLVCFKEALAVRERVLGGDHPHTVSTLNNLGVLLYLSGDYAGARSRWEQSLEVQMKLGSDHPAVATSLENLGALFHCLGDNERALSHLAEALEIRRRILGDDHSHTARSLGSLGALRVATGHASEGWRLMLEGITINDRVIGRVFASGSEAQRATFLATLRGELYGILSLALHLAPHAPSAESVVLDLVLRRKALGAEALVVQRDAVLGGRYPHLRENIRELVTLRSQIARTALAGAGWEDAQNGQIHVCGYGQIMAGLTDQKNQMERHLAAQIPEMSLKWNLRAADHRAVAFALDAEVALVEFVRFSEFDFRAVPARGERAWKPARYLAFVLLGGERRVSGPREREQVMLSRQSGWPGTSRCNQGT